MHANLFGDFVKGKDLSRFPPLVQAGIRLHREIDHYIDHHPTVIELLHELYTPLPKVAGIAIDLFFDHILAQRWKEFHPTPLADFTHDFYQSSVEHRDVYTENFLWMLEKMKEKNWLYQYQFKHGLYKASNGVSGRISFPNVLNTAPEVFEEHESSIQRSFDGFMKEAIPHFEQFNAQLEF